MSDRFTRGFVAGLVAAIPTLGVGYILYWTNYATKPYGWYVALILLGHSTRNWPERLLSIVWLLLFMGVTAIGYAYLIKWTGERNPYLKGMVYSGLLWFLIHALGTATDTALLWHVNWRTGLVHFVQALLFGALLPMIMRWLTDTASDRASRGY